MTTIASVSWTRIAILFLGAFILASSVTMAQSGQRKRVTAKGGRFTALLPKGFGKPVESEQAVPTALGSLKMKMFLAQTPDGTKAVMLAYIDYPKKVIEGGNPTTMLDSGQAGALANMPDAQLVSQDDVSLEGNPGRSVVFTTRSGDKEIHGRMDFYLVGVRLYQVFFASDDAGDLEREDVKDFFASLTLTRK
jgi:hypothetical protein